MQYSQLQPQSRFAQQQPSQLPAQQQSLQQQHNTVPGNHIQSYPADVQQASYAMVPVASPQADLVEQQDGPIVRSPDFMGSAEQPTPSQDELAFSSSSGQRHTQHTVHSLTEFEQRGRASGNAQGNTAQPSLPVASPQELELVAPRRVTGRDSPARDLTELEQQGSFTLTLDQSQAVLGGSTLAEPDQAAALARDIARRKGAQAELERQYSQLQLQHQQVRKQQKKQRLAISWTCPAVI